MSETRLPLKAIPFGVHFDTVLKGLQQDGKTPAEIKQALRGVKSSTDEEILAIDFSTDLSVLIEQFKAQINEALTAGAQ